MPFSRARFNRLMDLKGITQQDLAEKAGIAQSQVSDCKKGICRTTELTEKIARALDCTPDFLLNWSFRGVDDDSDGFRVGGRPPTALDVFEARITTGVEQKERCRRVVGHLHSPVARGRLGNPI